MSTIKIEGITLAKGGHANPEQGMCLLEAVAYVRGIEFSDHPPCVSTILGAYGRSLNDVLPDDKRQQLVLFIPRLIGTAGDDKDQARGLMAADWLIRVYTPTWLRLAGLDDAALSLETLPRQATWDDIQAAVPVVNAAKERAREARDAAWDAAWDAAGDAARAAARDAAGDAARAAARDAAWAAAWDAAGDAARVAASDAAWDAARAAARDAAWAAAWDAARAAARDAAGDAARAAARAHLAPTVAFLQDSAIELFDKLIEAVA